MKKLLYLFIYLCPILLLVTCKKEVIKVLSTVNTTAATNITSTTATSGGTITNDGGAPVTSRGVCWSLNQSPTTSDSKTSDDSGIGSFTSSIVGLSPGGTYYVRAYATNSVGIAYGNQVVLTTMSTLPTITTIAVTNISTTTAASGGFISFEGGSPVISRGVCWSTSENPTITDKKTSNGTGSSSFVSSITGLSLGTTYYIRAYATNSMGTGYGNQLSFTTSTIIPTLTTTAITDISTTSATSGGTISADGGASVTSRGVCWSIIQNPTTSDNKTSNGSGDGNFTSSIIGLIPNTTYYVRAYATNSVGTAYGTQISFTTWYGSVSDIDGNVYKIIVIGTQTWMAENLKTTKYRNGNLIGTTTPATLDISNVTTYPAPKYQWAYADNESNVTTYGRLYTWYAATDSRNVCPTGWHVPTDSEWTTLTTYLGNANVAGGKLKEAGTSHWPSPNTGATNSSGFTALPGGYRYSGSFVNIGGYGYWWSSTESENNPYTAWYRTMAYDLSSAHGLSCGKSYGSSVRCVKD